MLVACSIFSSYNFHWTAESGPIEDSEFVSRFERVRSHDVNDPTQNDIIVPMDESMESD